MSITIEARYQADTAAQAISNNATIDHNQLWLSGTATPGDLLRIYDGHSYLTLISADSSGRWNYPIELLADGDYQFQIQNLTAGVNSNSLAITIDTGGQTIPPVILPERTYIFEGGTSDDSTPTISGQLTPGTILTATANGYTYGPIEVGADGKWEIEMTEGLPEGESVVAFMLQQPSGQTAYYGMRMNIESPEPELTAVEAAVTAAAASSRVAPPSIEAVEDNVGRFQGLLQSGNHSDDDIPLMRGQAEAFALVEIYDNDVLIGSVYAAASGAWRYSPTTALPEGEHRFHAIQIDLNGERSGASDKFDIVIDRTAEVVTNLRAVDDVGAQTGVIPQNGVSDDEMPVIRGGGSPGATIEIFNGNISLGTAVVDANGEWSFAANLGEGEHIISAIHTDLAVNTGPRSEAINFEVRLGLEAAEAIRILDGGDEHLSQADLRGQVGVEVELS
ncbi:MAG: Ig-like domain-containing protein, partial [Cellvibrionaceae bacterium]|nr:Ig-like domain-containing protein [Cellvibrionaceae bacterium]